MNRTIPHLAAVALALLVGGTASAQQGCNGTIIVCPDGTPISPECCAIVCAVDPICCQIVPWDAYCCSRAQELCGPPPLPNPKGPGTVCGTCCQAQPSITGFTRPTALSTDYQYDLITFQNGDPNKIVLHVYEIGTPPAPPAVWATVPRYDNPGWTLGKLGTVFGVTTDDVGNIYLAHSAIFLSNEVGTLGGDTGAITFIDGTTAAAALLVNLPNSANGPGLGNLTWSCGYKSLYVTNFEDGRIYRVDPNVPAALRVQSAWDFSTDTLTLGGAPEAGDPVGLVPLGQRVWAVADGGDRLFFSVVNQDGSGSVGPNAIWSVKVNAVGDPIPGTMALEILLNGPGVLPNPVADLAFDNECCLYAAQRTMGGLNTGAHGSDLLKYCWIDKPGGGVWQQGPSFRIGDQNVGLDRSCAGGVGVDNGANGLVWASGDALAFGSPMFGGAVAYGLQGLPQTGGASPNAVLIDNDNDTTSQDKSQQGSCEVICKLGEPCEVVVDKVTCVLGADGYPNGEYSVVVTITNNSGQAATLLLVPTLGYFEYLSPPLQNGQSKTLKLIVTGNPGDVINLPIGLYDGTTTCCGVEAEFELPDCKCALFSEIEVECISDGDPNTYEYNVSFKVCNISQNPAFTATWLFFIPPQGSPYFFTPTVKNVFPLPSPGCVNVGPVKLTFTVPPGPNWTLDVPVSIHNANLAICCDAILRLEAPAPCAPSCSPDLNGDGVVNGADLALVLGSWGSSSGGCADLNSDGTVNGADLAIVLGNWS